MDRSPPDSSVHGILQARILERVAISSSRGSSQPRDQTCISHISCIAGRFFPIWVKRVKQLQKRFSWPWAPSMFKCLNALLYSSAGFPGIWCSVIGVPLFKGTPPTKCPCWHSVKNLLQSRRHRFHPCVQKIPWKRKQQPTSVFLPGKIPWTEAPGGLQSCRPWGSKRPDWASKQQPSEVLPEDNKAENQKLTNHV